MITATFGSKQFEVSQSKIYTPNGVSISEELTLEETEVSGKKPTISVKGIKLRSLSFELKLDARFVNVHKEITYWETTLKEKKSRMFTLGAYSLGQYYLTKTDIKDIILVETGGYASATLSLSFTEDGAVTSSNKSSTSSNKSVTTNKKAAAVKQQAILGAAVATVRKGSTIIPKNGTRWYYTADLALKKTGKSGKAYRKQMIVTYVYEKNKKIVCVNPQGLGWLKVEDVTVVKY